MGYIAIVDYGAGNLFSVKNALDFLGFENKITASADDLKAAGRLILPGVGAFPDAMRMLGESGLIGVIKKEAQKKPLLGICLGMQMLFEKGYEFGETEVMFRFAKSALRHAKGYTAKTNIIVSLLFAGMSGAAIADIGGLGQIEIKAMEEEGFDRDYAAALTAITSMVGPLFPPSIPLIIFAVCAQISSLQALMAGMLPAILITAVMYIFVSFQVNRKTLRPAQVQDDDRDKSFWRVTKESIHVLILVPAIIISMLRGIFSPSEAGAAAVLYLIIIEAVRGRFR